MLIKLLPEPERELLLDLVRLLALSDNPLLWDGKKYEELTSDTNLSGVSIQPNEQENELIADLERSAGYHACNDSLDIGSAVAAAYAQYIGSVKHQLTEKLKAFPINKVEVPENRLEASKAVLSQLLENKSTERPEVPKIMLFELFLVALRDGNITSIEWALLKEVQLHYRLEDFIFDDLLERAEALTSEVSKTIAIVLE